MKLFSRVAAAATALAMAVSMTACSDSSWAAESNGLKLQPGVYIGKVFTAYLNASQKVEDQKTDLLKQQVEGKDASQWITDNAMAETKKYFAIEQLVEELGITVPDELKAQVESQTETQWQTFGGLYEENGISKASYNLIMLNNQKKNLIFDKYYGKGGLEEVGDDPIKTYFKDNYMKMNFVAYLKQDKDGNVLDEAGLAALKEKAEKAFESLKSGTPLHNLIVDYENENLEEGKEKYTYDSTEIRQPQIIPKEDGDFTPADFYAELQKQADGAQFMFESEKYFFVAERYSVLDDPEDFTNNRSGLLSELKGEEFEQKLTDKSNSITVTFNDSAVKKYNASKIKVS